MGPDPAHRRRCGHHSLYGRQPVRDSRPALPAVIYAVTGIIGVVFIGGGIFLLHRPDSNRFFDSTGR